MAGYGRYQVDARMMQDIVCEIFMARLGGEYCMQTPQPFHREDEFSEFKLLVLVGDLGECDHVEANIVGIALHELAHDGDRIGEQILLRRRPVIDRRLFCAVHLVQVTADIHKRNKVEIDIVVEVGHLSDQADKIETMRE